MRTWVIAGVFVLASTGATLAQDAAAGQQAFMGKCSPCHAVGEGAQIKLGPPLNGIDGRKAGTVADYNYNEGIKNSGITWSDETFKEYIKDPRTKIPDTKMFFVGIKDEKEIGDLWAYLKQFSADGAKK